MSHLFWIVCMFETNFTKFECFWLFSSSVTSISYFHQALLFVCHYHYSLLFCSLALGANGGLVRNFVWLPFTNSSLLLLFRISASRNAKVLPLLMTEASTMISSPTLAAFMYSIPMCTDTPRFRRLLGEIFCHYNNSVLSITLFYVSDPATPGPRFWTEKNKLLWYLNFMEGG